MYFYEKLFSLVNISENKDYKLYYYKASKKHKDDDWEILSFYSLAVVVVGTVF